MPRSTCSKSVAVDCTTSSATGPQKAFESRRRLLCRHSLGSCLQQLNRQAVNALALTLVIGPVIRCRSFEPRDLRAQCHDL